ncbi:MAG: phage holin family protein [Anaerolineae bacterium]
MSTRFKEERSLGELFRDLLDDTRLLVRQEIELARTEMSQKLSQYAKDIAYIGIAGAVAYVGFMAIVAAAIIGLGAVIPMWLSALAVGVVLALVGYLFARRGMNGMKSRRLVPEQTVESLKEDKEWAQGQIRRNDGS